MECIIVLVLTATALATGCAQAPESDQATVAEEQAVSTTAQGDPLLVDLLASKVEWVGTKVTGRHNGEIRLKQGSLVMKDGQLTGGAFIIDMNSLSTKDRRGFENGLSEHLMSTDFFDVEQYPTAQFEITGVRVLEVVVPDTEEVPEISQYKLSNPTHEISGNLTIKGVTKNITFPATVEVSNGSVSSTAKFNINRKDWGITYPGKPNDLISETIHLGIGLKASKTAI